MTEFVSSVDCTFSELILSVLLVLCRRFALVVGQRSAVSAVDAVGASEDTGAKGGGAGREEEMAWDEFGIQFSSVIRFFASLCLIDLA